MIAGTFVLARLPVDRARLDARAQRFAGQDDVDAQALVPAKGQVAVIPPAPALGWLFEQPERIRQPEGTQLLEMRTFFRRAVDLSGPGRGVMDVAVLGRDVEVTHQHQLRVALQFGGDKTPQRVQPAHLVDELVAVRRLAVGEVGADHAHITGWARYRGGDHARQLVIEARDVLHDLARRARAAEQRDAVVGLLAVEHDLVARSLDLGLRELVVGKLGFLQHHDVHRAVGGLRCQPVQQLRQAHGQGVHVPGGEFHHRRLLLVGLSILFTSAGRTPGRPILPRRPCEAPQAAAVRRAAVLRRRADRVRCAPAAFQAR